MAWPWQWLNLRTKQGRGVWETHWHYAAAASDPNVRLPSPALMHFAGVRNRITASGLYHLCIDLNFSVLFDFTDFLNLPCPCECHGRQLWNPLYLVERKTRKRHVVIGLHHPWEHYSPAAWLDLLRIKLPVSIGGSARYH